ncbi:MAG: hypothetical protein WAV21_02375 [Minisyncoccia bacterium]
MPPKEETSALERMRSKLYTPGGKTGFADEKISTRSQSIPRGWNQEPSSPLARLVQKQKLPLALKFLIAAGIFFLIAGGVAFYFLVLGGRSVSTTNIDISVKGPTTIAGGDTVPLEITIKNRNPVVISASGFSVIFPDGTRASDDVTKAYDRYTDSLGDIPPGEQVTRTVRAVLFGSQNQVVTIPIKFEYKTQNSKATFVKETEYTLTITTSPISVSATGISELPSGQSVTFSLAVRSNAPKTLADVAVQATYPFGFVVSNISIPSENNGKLISIGTLSPGEEKRFTVTGVLTGQNNDERVFHWNAGVTTGGTNGSLGVAYASSESAVTITRPFLDATLTIGDDASTKPVISSGKTTRALVSWTNTLATQVLDGEIIITVSGSALDTSSIVTDRGFYQSSNNTIRFDRDTDSDLRTLEPGDTGTGAFSFATKKGSAFASLRNPTISFSVSVNGRRVSESNVPSALSATLTRVVKIATNLNISSRIVRTTGSFENSGAWPPVAGSETTYTVLLSADNDVNDVGGASATMTLPSYVRFTSVSEGSVTYTEATRIVKWNIGDVPAGGSKQAAFQIGFLPSSSQKGTSPTLVSEAKITGIDRFTQTVVGGTSGSLTTQAKTDPAYQTSFGTVQ